MSSETLLVVAAGASAVAAALSAGVALRSHVLQMRREQRAELWATLYRGALDPTRHLEILVWNDGPGVAESLGARLLGDPAGLAAQLGAEEIDQTIALRKDDAASLEAGSYTRAHVPTKTNVSQRLAVELTWFEQSAPGPLRRRLPLWLGGRKLQRRRRVLVLHVGAPGPFSVSGEGRAGLEADGG